MDFKFSVLGSASSGNSSLVWDNTHSFLVDCGFPVKYIKGCLQDFYLNPTKLNGMLLTHTHADHYSNTVFKFLISHDIRFYIHEDLVGPLLKRSYDFKRAFDKNLVIKIGKDPFKIGEFKIEAFPVPHDSFGGCFGYNISKRKGDREFKITYATDLAFTTDEIENSFVDSDVIVIESNHDVEMLYNSGRPRELVDRIRKTGHLSNEECADFLVRVIKKSKVIPEKIILTHISQQCNTNDMALRVNKTALELNGFQDIEVIETFQRMPTDIIEPNYSSDLDVRSQSAAQLSFL